MEIKVGDLIKDRYILKMIMQDPYNNFKPIFFLYDKKEEKIVEYNEEEIKKLLEIKE